MLEYIAYAKTCAIQAGRYFMKDDRTQMTVNLDTRRVESEWATEIYISAAPAKSAPLQQQLCEIFSRIADIIRSEKAHILQERIFATQGVMEIVRQIRSNQYGDIDDGVPPSLLVGREGLFGPISGAQVHAVNAGGAPEVVSLDGKACGRILHLKDRTYLTLSGISALQFQNAKEQARAILEKSESALKQFAANIFSVARTWMWLGDILSWYDDFNRVRNEFFAQRGAIGKGSTQAMPASTGIGLTPANGGKCAMDLIAVLAPAGAIEYLQAVGRQQSAFEYGSAFSRACRAITPAAETVFISGTASIDAGGNTVHIGDIPGQINATIENVRAVLRDMRCRDEQVVQVVAYCKNTEVEKIFNDLKGRLHWPWVTAICDICRPELLFEIEAVGMPDR